MDSCSAYACKVRYAVFLLLLVAGILVAVVSFEAVIQISSQNFTEYSATLAHSGNSQSTHLAHNP